MVFRRDTVAEWLRRWTRNPLGSARVGSNPTGVVFITSFKFQFGIGKRSPKELSPAGFEPARTYVQQILSLPPLNHSGKVTDGLSFLGSFEIKIECFLINFFRTKNYKPRRDAVMTCLFISSRQVARVHKTSPL